MMEIVLQRLETQLGYLLLKDRKFIERARSKILEVKRLEDATKIDVRVNSGPFTCIIEFEIVEFQGCFKPVFTCFKSTWPFSKHMI